MFKRTVVILVCVAVMSIPLAIRHFGCTNTSGSSHTAVKRPITAETGYAAYDRVLSTYVNQSGMVDYAGIREIRSDLDTFKAMIAGIDPAQYDSWDKSAQIAFWLNAYNGLTLIAIVERYPIQPGLIRRFWYPKNSIRQIPGVWNDLEWNVMGRWYTLDAIEHDVLRGRFDEPRIHAALVCAAMGCPPLRNEAYVGEKLDSQLDEQMRRFLSDPKKFRIDREDGTVYLSPIFKWFGHDFVDAYASDRFADRGAVEGAVLTAFSEYVSPEDRQYLLSEEYSVKYFDYDWSLNEQ